MRIVVNIVGDGDRGQLAESRFVERPYLPGGEHNMYELAFAAASLGHDVELRGWLHRGAFERMKAGASAAPRVELASREPTADDLVVVPEGWVDPLDYARVLLSPATPALFILAAPGLFGWPFTAGWTRPDPLTVPLDSLARPEHFAAYRAAGFELLTHSKPIAEAAAAAAIQCAFVGTGRPGFSALPAVEKSVDVALVVDNRWASLADRVLAALPSSVSRDRIEQATNEDLLERLNRARILIWPSRIEGHATIPWEARGVGCVPVALDSNRFAVGLDPDHGAVLSPDLEALAATVVELLGDHDRWAELSDRGRRTAPAEVDWAAYLERVGAFLGASRAPDAALGARADMGAALAKLLDERAAAAQTRQQALLSELEAVRSDRKLLHETLQPEIDRINDARAELQAQLDEIRSRPAVRAALAVMKTLGR